MTKKPSPHKNHSKNCKICAMSKTTQEEIKFLYINWERLSVMKKKYQVTIQCLNRHAKQVEWFEQRMENTEAKQAFIADIVDDTDFKGSDATKALDSIDKKRGKVEDKEDSILKRLDGLTLAQINQELKRLEGNEERIIKENSPQTISKDRPVRKDIKSKGLRIER